MVIKYGAQMEISKFKENYIQFYQDKVEVYSLKKIELVSDSFLNPNDSMELIFSNFIKLALEHNDKKVPNREENKNDKPIYCCEFKDLTKEDLVCIVNNKTISMMHFYKIFKEKMEQKNFFNFTVENCDSFTQLGFDRCLSVEKIKDVFIKFENEPQNTPSTMQIYNTHKDKWLTITPQNQTCRQFIQTIKEKSLDVLGLREYLSKMDEKTFLDLRRGAFQEMTFDQLQKLDSALCFEN